MEGSGDDHGLYGHSASSSPKVRPPSSKAAAERLLRASRTVEAHVLNKLAQLEAEREETASSSSSHNRETRSGPADQGEQDSYPYPRRATTTTTAAAAAAAGQQTQQMQPSGGTGPGSVAGGASSVGGRAPSSGGQQKGGVVTEGAGIRDVLEEARQQARQAARSIPGVAQAAAQREKEAGMLRDMFKAVWPDLGAFKAWGSATKVASLSGSLSLSLAFFGVVYWLGTKYDREKGKKETS